MSSSRLPGKVLLPICGIPILEHIVNRLSHCKQVKNIVIATSDDSSDDPIEDFALKKKYLIYRGSLNDVLDRYYQAATKFGFDTVIRVTGDCPLVEPTIVDQLLNDFYESSFDCFSVGPNFPDGLDCQIFSIDAIKKAWLEAKLPSEREHVGPYIENNPKIFRLGSKNFFPEYKNFRLTLDEPEDLELITRIYEKFFVKDSLFPIEEVFYFLKNNPKLVHMNSHIIRNEGYIKSTLCD